MENDKKLYPYIVTTSITREVYAENKEEAENEFWEQLEHDNTMENTTTENRLADNMKVEEV